MREWLEVVLCTSLIIIFLTFAGWAKGARAWGDDYDGIQTEAWTTIDNTGSPNVGPELYDGPWDPVVEHLPMYGDFAYQLRVPCHGQGIVEWGINQPTAEQGDYEIALVIAVWRGVLTPDEFVFHVTGLDPAWKKTARDFADICAGHGTIGA